MKRKKQKPSVATVAAAMRAFATSEIPKLFDSHAITIDVADKAVAWMLKLLEAGELDAAARVEMRAVAVRLQGTLGTQRAHLQGARDQVDGLAAAAHAVANAIDPIDPPVERVM